MTRLMRLIALGTAVALIWVIISAYRGAGFNRIGPPSLQGQPPPLRANPPRRARTENPLPHRSKSESRAATNLCELRGTVTWSSDSLPVKGLWISTAPVGGGKSEGQLARTDAAGGFTFRSLRKVPHRILMQVERSSRWISHWRLVDLTNHKQQTEVRFSIPCCEIRGIARDPDGNVMPNAVVRIYSKSTGWQESYKLSTDRDGGFEILHFPMEQAKITLSIAAWKRGFRAETATRTISPNDSLALVFDFKRVPTRVTAQGIVVDQDGRVLKGATVYALCLYPRNSAFPASAKGNLRSISVDGSPVFTDQNGRFSIQYLNRNQEMDLIAVMGGHAGVVSRTKTPATGSFPGITIRLQRGDSTLRGVVVDSSGKAISAAWVTAHDQSYGVKGSALFQAETNRLGEYELPLIAGRKYLLEAYKKGFSFPGKRQVTMTRHALAIGPLRLIES